MKISNKAILLSLFAVIAVLIAWAFMPKAVKVQTAEVTRGKFQQVIEEDGKTRVRNRYVVSAPVSGRLMRISLKAGNLVKQDDVVAMIVPNAPALLDARSMQELTERVGAAEAAKSRAIAEQARAQAALEKAEMDLTRYKSLATEGFISPSQLSQIELTLKVSLRELDAAKQVVHIADHDVATARAAVLRSQSGEARDRVWAVRSPVGGSVLRVPQESEGAVALGAPLLEVGDPGEIEIVVDVLSSDAVQVKEGAAVMIERWGQPTSLQGRVRMVEPSAFTKISALGVEEQRVNVVVDIVSPREQWTALNDGYRIVARIVVFTAENAINIPTGALFRKGTQWEVFVADKGRASERAVSVSHRSESDAMIDKGLQPGERVVIYPGDSLKDGIKISDH